MQLSSRDDSKQSEDFTIERTNVVNACVCVCGCVVLTTNRRTGRCVGVSSSHTTLTRCSGRANVSSKDTDAHTCAIWLSETARRRADKRGDRAGG